MNWRKSKLTLNPGTVPYDKIYSKYVGGSKICAYCGGKYFYNMRRINVNEKDYICCDICYHITRISAAPFNSIQLCFSKLSQEEIVQKTVSYIIKYDNIPLFPEIDKDVEIIPLSIIEYSNILLSKRKTPSIMDNYKIFITQDYDTNYIKSYSSSFDDEDDVDDVPIAAECNIRKLTAVENKFLKRFFSN